MNMKKKKPPKLFGEYMKSPGPYYAGGALHYIDKNGKVKHDRKRTITQVKKLIMTKTEFNKRYEKQ